MNGNQVSKTRFRMAKLLAAGLIVIVAYVLTINASGDVISALVIAGAFALLSCLWLYLGQIIYAKRIGVAVHDVNQLCVSVKATIITIMGCLLWPLVLKALPKA